MKRSIIAAAATAAVLATAASAAAAPPQYQSCVKAAKSGKAYTGAYANKTCSEASPEHNGKYELGPLTKLPAKVTGKLGKVDIYLYNPMLDKIEGHFECASGKETGSITGAREGTATLSYSGCQATGSLAGPCNSPGQKAGAVVTHPLVSRLAWLDEAQTVPGIQLTPEAEGGAITSVVCAGGAETAELLGTLTGSIEPTTAASKSQTLAFEASATTGEPEYKGSWEGGVYTAAPLISNLYGLKEYAGVPTGQSSTVAQKGPAVLIG